MRLLRPVREAGRPYSFTLRHSTESLLLSEPVFRLLALLLASFDEAFVFSAVKSESFFGLVSVTRFVTVILTRNFQISAHSFDF